MTAQLQRDGVVSVWGVTPKDYRSNPAAAEKRLEQTLRHEKSPAHVQSGRMYLNLERPEIHDAERRRDIVKHELVHLLVENFPLQGSTINSDWIRPSFFQRIMRRHNPLYQPFATRMIETLKECAAIGMQYGFLDNTRAPSKHELAADEPGHMMLAFVNEFQSKTLMHRLLLPPVRVLVRGYCRMGLKGSTHLVAYNFARALWERGRSDVLLDLLKNPFVPGVDPRAPGKLSPAKFRISWREFCDPAFFLKQT